MLSTTKEDYLRAFYILAEKKGEVKSVDVAHYLKVSKPSVSEMVRELDEDGLVKYERYSPLKLTKKGRELASNLTSKHRLIEIFLRDILKVDSRNIHEEAHRLEHAFSDESIRKLRRFLGNPKKDPHGKPIPTIKR